MSNRDRHSAGPAGAAEAGMRERIRLLVELSRAKEAVEQARKARARGDASAELDELEGLAHVRLGDYPAALEALHRGLRTSPERSHLHYLRSFAERSLGNAAVAQAALDEALRLAPEEPVYLRAYAELLSEGADHVRALVMAREAVRCGPDRAANFVTLGFVLSSSGDKRAARGAYEKALELDPEDATAWNNLGCLELDEGNALQARERFRESLRLTPEGSRARKNLDQTLEGRTLEGFVRWSDFVRALAEELVSMRELALLGALTLEADEAGPVLAAARRGLPVARFAGVGGVAVGFLLGLGAPAALGAGVLASVGARHLLREPRRRIRGKLSEARARFEAIRVDWLEGRIERSARDVAARRLVERVTLELCEAPKKECDA